MNQAVAISFEPRIRMKGRSRGEARRQKRAKAVPSAPRAIGFQALAIVPADSETQSIADIIALRRERGEVIERKDRQPGEQERHYMRKPGLDWLYAKGRIQRHQKLAGERYGRHYRFAACETMLGSQLGDRGGGSAQDGGRDLIERAVSRAHAMQQLDQARDILVRQPTMLRACDLVCGEECRPLEICADERDALRLEAVLIVALDILAGLWDIGPDKAT